jgi:pSer/pThr/pTyr-binding forkhead associated (FHA) protein
MARVTFQVIEGLEKGRVYAELPTPVTIGREDDNAIRLNDERVSRFHAKIQEDGGRLILTDLDSTNGTRVNGHPVQMRILQFGDQVSVGRSLLVFGSREQLDERLRTYRGQGHGTPAPESRTIAIPGLVSGSGSDSDFQVDPDLLEAEDDSSDEFEELFPNGPPEVPQGLRPVHAAQVSDVFAYLHNEIAILLDAAKEEQVDGFAQMQVDWQTWQRLLHLEMDLAVYLRKISEPNA